MKDIAIIGATGYTGEELINLLLHHSEVRIKSLFVRSSAVNKKIDTVFPYLKGNLSLVLRKINKETIVRDVKDSEIVFLATPHETSLTLVPGLLSDGKKVIDLSADFRFDDCDVYHQWYNARHSEESSTYNSEAVYGLPELYREKIKTSRIVANPGCYPTSVILGCAPLLKKKVVQPESIIIDSKSGISGAGREFVRNFNSNDSFKAYKVTDHRHKPEIEQELSKLAGSPIRVSFVPHLLPIHRGILSTIYMSVKHPVSNNEIIEIFNEFYKDEPFIRVLSEGKLPEIKNVSGTNYCEIGVAADNRTRRLIVITAIDNLRKGASGQAIQNMNIMCGFEETTGLVLCDINN